MNKIPSSTLFLFAFLLTLLLSTGCSGESSAQKDFGSCSPAKSPAPSSDEAPTEFSDWEEAYRYVLLHVRSYLGDPYGLYGQWQHEIFDLTDTVLRIGLHDFDEDGIPELVLGAETSVIYSYKDKNLIKCAEFSLPQDMYRLDEFYFDGETIFAVVNSDPEINLDVFAACRFENRQYLFCLCDKDSSCDIVLNRSPKYSCPRYWLDPREGTVRTEESIQKYGFGSKAGEEDAIPISEDFDMKFFMW